MSPTHLPASEEPYLALDPATSSTEPGDRREKFWGVPASFVRRDLDSI